MRIVRKLRIGIATLQIILYIHHMKGWYRFFCISLLTLTLHSCIVSHSAVLTKNIQPGMSIRQIVGLLGQPYKVARHTGDNGQKIETYYYKEKLWVAYTQRLIENILIFEDSTLIAIEQGPEVDPDQRTISKD